MTALFSANKGEWFTPPEIIKRVHAVMGGIDLDPASCEKANTIVGARNFYTAKHDPLNRQWNGRVFVNPPGTCIIDPTKVEIFEQDGKDKRKQLPGYFTVCGNAGICSCDLPKRFWDKLIAEYTEGRVTSAIYLGFSLNQLATLQYKPAGDSEVKPEEYFRSPMDFPLCIIKQRLKFLDSETLEPVPGPTQHNFVSYINGTGMKFRAEFASLGACK